VIIAAAGCGKTRLFVMAATSLAAMNRGMPGIVTEPTYPMVTGILEPAFDELFEEYKIRHRFSARKHDYYLPDWDATIMCRSGEKPRRLRGPSVGWFGMDEVADQAEEVFTTLQGRNRHRLPGVRRAILAGTPRGFDWVYRKFGEPGGAERLAGSVLHRAGAADNYIVTAADPNWIPSMLASYDPELARQEIFGEFVAIGQSTTYYAFSAANRTPHIERVKEWPLIVMPGFTRSPLSWVCGQWNPEANRLECLVETRNETTTEQACAWVLSRFGSPGRETVYEVFMDGTSATPLLSANFSDSETIRDRLMCAPKVSRKLPRLRDRTNSTNALLRNAAGKHRMLISEIGCPRLIKDFEQVKNLPGTFDVDGSDPTLTHYSRAVSVYAVMQHPIIAGRGK
jgi:hypothetical protein